MQLNTAVLCFAAATAIFRLAEIAYGEWNSRAMLRDGGQEFASWQRWPIFIGYALWLAVLLIFVFVNQAPNIFWIGMYIFMEILRWWAIAHLGKYWTTRVIIVPHGSRITTGPYRFIPHPIYIALFGEVVALSLGFGQTYIAMFFGGLTALWIFFRTRAEDAALATLK